MPSKEQPKIYVDMAGSLPDQMVTTQEVPTALLRWNEGVLEQRIELKEWNNRGDMINWTTFWRPVPTFAANGTGGENAE